MDVNTGAALVVNLTGPGSLFGPGYVARYVINGMAYSVGEGANWMQAQAIPLNDALQWGADEYLWGRQMSQIIAASKSRCGCGH